TLRALSSTRPPSTATYTLSLHDALPIWRIERLLRPEALAGGPGGEQTHGLLGLRTRFGRVDGEGKPVFGFHVHALVGQSHLPDHRMAEGLEPGTVVADIVSAPTATELVAAGRQLTDEVVEFLVVRV